MSVPPTWHPLLKVFWGWAGRREALGRYWGDVRYKPPSPCAASSQLSAASQPDGVWRPSSDHSLSPSPSLPQPRRDLMYVCAFPQPFPSRDEERKKNKTAGLQRPPAWRVIVSALGFPGPRRECPGRPGGLSDATPCQLLPTPRADVPVGSRCHFEGFFPLHF